jgi:CubicO group peptidase (beta-lactamase class C family)
MDRSDRSRRLETGNRRRRRGAAVALVVLVATLAGIATFLGLGSSSAGATAGQVTAPRATPPVTLPPAVPSAINHVSPAGLDAYVRAQMKIAHLPGVSACVVRDGDIVWAKGYGWANIARQRRVTPDTDFMLASVSKTFVATAVMQQVEAGNLSLFADVNTYLPFPVRNPRHPDDPITLLQLLTHTSSIRDYWPVWNNLYVFGRDSRISLADFCRGYFVPGGRFYNSGDYYRFAPYVNYRYSNMGVTLAAYIVESVSGTPFDAYCNANIFAPLGMNTTSWKLAGLDRRTIAMPYWYDYGSGRYHAYGHYGYPDYPDGQLRTSASQLGRFLALHMNGGTYQGVQLLQPATVTQMLTPAIYGIARKQGLVWYRWNVAGWDVIGHNGGDMGVSTNMYYDENTGTGVVLLANGEAWTWREWNAMMDLAAKLFEVAPQL